jgi:hypothetical protein
VIKAWHLLHKATYPDGADARVKVLLCSSAKADAIEPPREMKGAVHLHHLLFLVEHLLLLGPKEKAILELALVAFWGMARIGELMSPHPEGSLDNQKSIFYSDVEWMEYHGQTAAVLSIRDAKTSQPGEVQKIVLRPIANLLCPVEAVKRRLQVEGNPDNALFGYPNKEGIRIHLTKDAVTKTLSSVWKVGGFHKITGHSFRVGGALYCFAMGVSVEEICKLGRWKSNCNKSTLDSILTSSWTRG